MGMSVREYIFRLDCEEFLGYAAAATPFLLSSRLFFASWAVVVCLFLWRV